MPNITVPAAATGLPSDSQEHDPSRRALLVGAAIVGADLAPYARPVRAATFEPPRGDLASARRAVDDAKLAFAAATERLETSLPRMHPLLLFKRGVVPFDLCTAEVRHFNNSVVYRGQDAESRRVMRHVISSEIVEMRLSTGGLTKMKRRRLRRILRRAKRYEAALEAAEVAAGLETADGALEAARRRLYELADSVMALPTYNDADLRRKAEALITFASSGDEPWQNVKAGMWGVQLANELLASGGRAA